MTYDRATIKSNDERVRESEDILNLVEIGE